MKHIKYLFLVCMSLMAGSCSKYDDLKDDVSALGERVALIEEQVKMLNDNVAVMSYILDPQNRTISGVRTENGTYVITLSDGTALTLTVGQPGTINEPEITVEDGYWCINGERTDVSAVGVNGKNGEGYPEFRVQDGKWQVRYGEESEWKDVPGGDAGDASLGDQLFESAEVNGNELVVVMKSGDTYRLPIVPDLTCAISKSGFDASGYMLFEYNQRKEVNVTIEGDNPQITYPEGWRAVLVKKDEADASGTHTLTIYSPMSDEQTETLSRSGTASNEEDVTVSVQKGVYWAMDKIRVKIGTPVVEPTGNMAEYEEGKVLTIGNFELTKSGLGGEQSVEVTEDVSISESGVYFVSANDVTLTYDGDEPVENLVILPNSEEVTSITLNASKQVKFTGTLALQNVNVQSGLDYAFSSEKEGAVNVAFNQCSMDLIPGAMDGANVASKGLLTQAKGEANMEEHTLAYFEMSDSDVRVTDAGVGLYLIDNMDCTKLVFDNNLVYYTGTPTATDYVKDFNVFHYGTGRSIDELVLTSNTFIDVESESGKTKLSNTRGGIVYPYKLPKANVSNNLYYLALQNHPAFLIKTHTSNKVETLVKEHNYGYRVGSSNFNVFQNAASTLPEGSTTGFDTAIDGVNNIFNATEGAVFDKESGVFTPVDVYKNYGAQRN